ncbi:MAG: hypothetical protein NPIRA02_00260 [Nitrospirales bacterium]|nr:MAG: hypothetical protein NPIRA02_00260 [Nitrospirales bacterium]
MFDACIEETPEGVILSVHIQPRAAKTEYIGLYRETAFKFRVMAPPVDGEANEALCRYLAKHFGVAKRSVVIVRGSNSRHKRVLLKGVSVEHVTLGFTRWQSL